MNFKRYKLTSIEIPIILVLIMAGALFLRIIYWWLFIQPFHEIRGDAVFYYNAAHSIADTLSYSINGKHTAIKPPGYPVFAGLILMVFGDDRAVILLQYLFGVLASLPIYWIARHYLNENRASLVVLAYLIYPTTWFWESSFMSESLYVWLNNLFLFFMHRYMMTNNNLDLAHSSFWGTASFLTRPAAIFPLGIIFVVIIFQKSFRKAMSFATVWCIVFLLVLSPWIYRNFNLFKKIIPASNSAGVTLYTSYVSWGYDMSIVNFLPHDQITLASLDSEYEKNKFLLQRTFEFLSKNPMKMVTLIPYKLKDFLHPFNGRWYPISLGSKFNLFYSLLACFAMLGFWWNRKEKAPIVKLSLAFVVGAVISVIVFHGELRYRFVLNPILFLLAGLCFMDRFNTNKKKIIKVVVILNLSLWGAGIVIP